MFCQNVTEVFSLPPLTAGFSSVLPFHPLDLVVAEDATPKLIVSYDWYFKHRIKSNLPRHTSLCTHVFVTVLPAEGEPPVTAGFSAACLAEVFENGVLRQVHPGLQQQASEIFGVLKELPAVLKAAHPHLLKCVPGCVVKEEVHMADSFMSTDLRTDAQIRGALDVIEQRRVNPLEYETRGTKGVNCRDFVQEVMEGAGVKPPFWWGPKPWPGIDARALEFHGFFKGCLGRETLPHVGAWLLQPKAITQIMLEAALDVGAVAKVANMPSGKPPQVAPMDLANVA